MIFGENVGMTGKQSEVVQQKIAKIDRVDGREPLLIALVKLRSARPSAKPSASPVGTLPGPRPRSFQRWMTDIRTRAGQRRLVDVLGLQDLL